MLCLSGVELSLGAPDDPRFIYPSFPVNLEVLLINIVLFLQPLK